jgi:hypothetical protein
LGCALLAVALWHAQGGAGAYRSAWPGPWAVLLLALMWGLYAYRSGFPAALFAGAP